MVLRKMGLVPLLVVNLLWGDEQFFGLEFGKHGVESKNVIGASISSSGVEGGVKVGAQNHYWRTAFSTHYSKDDSRDSLELLISIDRYIFASIYESEDNILKPYFGFTGGWLNYKDDGIDGDGLTYGVDLGITWGLSGGVDIDLGYRRLVTGIDEVESINITSISLNYIF